MKKRKSHNATKMTESDRLAQYYRDAIQGLIEKNRHHFDGLTPSEQRDVMKHIVDAVTAGNINSSVRNTLWEIDYDRKPVPVYEFLTDPYYLGKTCAELDDPWMHDLCTIFAPGTRLFEWYMTGAIGTGKTTVATAANIYKLYLLSCLRDPAAYYELLPGSLIVLGIYSITLDQVGDTGYTKAINYVDTSPYFKECFPRNMRLKNKMEFINKPILIQPGSRDLHAIGRDLFGIQIDEMNFFANRTNPTTGEQMGQAYKLYNATSTRLYSRFLRDQRPMPGLMMLMSSKNITTSFLEQRIRAVNPNYVDGTTGWLSETVYVSSRALWETKPPGRYGRHRFKVEVGDRLFRSRVLSDSDIPRPGARIIEVPDNSKFRESFLLDTDQALRDLAGVATLTSSPLIYDGMILDRCVSDKLEHPFTSQDVCIPEQDGMNIDEFFAVSKACRIEAGAYVPKLNPSSARYIHVDSSLTGDCTGIAMVHRAGTHRVSQMKKDGTYSFVEAQRVVVDFVLRVRPPSIGQIPLAKVVSFIQYLRTLFPVRHVTYDGWQSAFALQILRASGLSANVQSVDRTDDAYLALRDAIASNTITLYRHETLFNELLELQRDVEKGKVDHPETSASTGQNGSKDVSDALAGAHFSAINDPDSDIEVSVYRPSAVTSEPKSSEKLRSVLEKNL